MTTLLAPKTFTFVAFQFEYDAVFGATEFASATGYAQLQGPLSLSIDLQNNTKSPWYVGITITRDIGTNTVADRAHIGGIRPLSSATISPASIPQLARINGIITKITVRISAFESLLSAPAGISTVALRIDPPIDIFSPPLYIGQDVRVPDPSFHVAFDTEVLPGVNVTAATTDQLVLSTGTMAAPFRHHTKYICLGVPPTPSFPGDVYLRARLTRLDNLAYFLGDLTSEQFSPRSLVLPLDTYLNIGEKIDILGTNYNAANAYPVTAFIAGEFVY